MRVVRCDRGHTQLVWVWFWVWFWVPLWVWFWVWFWVRFNLMFSCRCGLVRWIKNWLCEGCSIRYPRISIPRVPPFRAKPRVPCVPIEPRWSGVPPSGHDTPGPAHVVRTRVFVLVIRHDARWRHRGGVLWSGCLLSSETSETSEFLRLASKFCHPV